MKPVLSSNEAKLLYAVLDAAYDDGLLRDPLIEKRWLAIRRQAVSVLTLDRASLYWLVQDLDMLGVLNRTWMQGRWLTVKERIESAPMEFPPSQAPFSPR